MKITGSILVFFSLIIVGCTEGKKHQSFPKEPIPQPFLFELGSYLSKEELNVSFPIWFNDSLIRENGIKTITRKSHFVEIDNSLNNHREERLYTFTMKGELESLQIKQYYDYQVISDITIKYLSNKDIHGFSLVKMKESKGSLNSDLKERINVHHIENYTNRFLAYANESTGNYLFYMLNEENWGSLSIDSILRPSSNDIIVLGSPKNPSKKYQVENTVNEFNVVSVNYASNGFLNSILHDEFPFTIKRTITRDKLGMCDGYIDSTFTNSDFIKRKVSSFSMEGSLPVKLTHINNSRTSENKHRQVEVFEYQFFE